MQQNHSETSDIGKRTARWEFGKTFSAAEIEAIICQLTENTDLVFFLHSPGYQHLHYVSSAFEKIWGVPCNRLLENRMFFFNTLHPEDRDRVALDLCGEHSQRYEKEYRIVTPSGSIRWIRDLSIPLRNEKGAIWIIVGFAEDISSRKYVEQQLKEMVKTQTSDLLEINNLLNREIEERKKTNNELLTNKARLEAILNASKDAWFLADTKGTLLLLNQALADRFGKTKEALLGKNLHSLYSPELAKSRLAILEQLLATKAAVNFKDTRDGHIFDNCAYPIFDKEDRMTQLAVFSRDVTHEIQAQTALAESENRYRSFVQNFNGIAFQSVITGETHFTSLFCHGAVESITGYTERDYTLKQENWEDIIHPEDRKRFLESRKQLAAIPDTSLEIEYRLKRKDHQYRWVKESVQNIRGNSGKPILVEGVIYDISDRKHAEMTVKQLSRRLLDRIEDERKKIARDLHDEFGQILTALRFNLEEVMRVSLTNAPPVQNDAFSFSNKYGCMIQQIEALSESVRRITTELRPDLLDHLGLDSAIHWHIGNFLQQHPAVQVTYEMVGLKHRLDARTEIALYRVFQEGLNNIVKHAKAGHIRISLICSFPSVILKLEDDGVGFVSQPRGTDSEFHLKGIGLLSMRERIAAIGGSIKIDSAIGKGTRIRVEAPYYRRNSNE